VTGWQWLAKRGVIRVATKHSAPLAQDSGTERSMSLSLEVSEVQNEADKYTLAAWLRALGLGIAGSEIGISVA
jgi:hypothetical protein